MSIAPYGRQPLEKNLAGEKETRNARDRYAVAVTWNIPCRPRKNFNHANFPIYATTMETCSRVERQGMEKQSTPRVRSTYDERAHVWNVAPPPKVLWSSRARLQTEGRRRGSGGRKRNEKRKKKNTQKSFQKLDYPTKGKTCRLCRNSLSNVSIHALSITAPTYM